LPKFNSFENTSPYNRLHILRVGQRVRQELDLPGSDQTMAAAYQSQVLRVALSRLLLVKPPGMLVLRPSEDSYRASEIAADLLGLSAKTGRIEELNYVFDEAEHTEDQNTALLIFKNAKGEVIRLRQLETVERAAVFVVEDVTPIVNKEFELARQGRDFRGLFEHAPFGIYRSLLDGHPIRCNPTMLRFNGFDTEQELFAAMTDTGKSWYVDPNQRALFVEILKRDGIVVDFISEVRLHNTGATMWVSETAWLFTDQELGLEVIEGTAIDATARVEQEQALRKSANTDWLTGLANRSAFHAHIAACLPKLPRDQALAVLLIDLDRFKDVNDVFGHARGDMLLSALAKRLQSYAPHDAFLARLGGDEFGLVVPCNKHSEGVEELGYSLAQEVTKPFKLEGSEHVVGASMGLAIYPQHAATSIDLIKAADLALYKSKKIGRGELEVFDANLAKEKTRQAELIRDLRGADQRGELELHYQPVVDAKTSAVAGFEALMRWRNPKRGLVPPMEFIPIAEEAGLMVGFGNWAIDQACMHAATLPRHMHIAVNVSAVQFYSADLPKIVSAALNKHGISAARLELEVTESFLLINEALTRQVLEELKQLGVSIVLDDFGTGYSSLSYLQRFNFDKVKIDKSFVRSLKSNAVNSAIVRAVLSIGRDLGLAVVAEGIETETERNDLLEEGCPFFQGYLYGRPKPLSDVTADLSALQLRQILPSAAETEQLKETA
jgi:diguanylate cyclase (GGDEF)-like protein